MDGKKWGLGLSLSLFLFLTACSQGDQGGTFVKSDIGACSGAALGNQFIVNWKDGSRSVENADTEQEFLDGFFAENRKDIRFAEPDYAITNQDAQSIGPMDSSSTPPNWGAAAIHADVAWNQNFQGQGVVVAVVDSGVDLSRPSLQGQLYQNLAELNGVAGVDDDGNGLVDDINGYNFDKNSPTVIDESGHGTHVSGTILANPAQGEVQGVAPKAKLLPVDFMNEFSGSTSNAIRAINYAVSRGANVINASWGSGACSLSLKNTFAQLDQTNVLIVVAAGNGGSDGVGDDLSVLPDFPAFFHGSNQITVGAEGPSGFRATFSNFGTLVHLLAPGVKIYSTVPLTKSSTGYAFFDGTSMATPHVTGMAAALWSKNPSATAKQIKNAIINSVDLFNNQDLPRGRARLDKALDLL
jgi:subtilisin family serine protease